MFAVWADGATPQYPCVFACTTFKMEQQEKERVANSFALGYLWID